MKPHLITLFILFLSFSVLAQEYKESELPAKVVTTFKSKFAPSGKASWTKKADVFVASFKEDGQDVLASFTPEGALSETKYAIPYKELPGAIATYIETNFKEAKVKGSYQRVTPTEPIHYYVVLKKEGSAELAELWFDMKGKFTKKNVPDNFNKSTGIVDVKIEATVHAPKIVCDSFAEKLPGASLQYWRTDSTNFTATFIKDEMTGRAEFGPDGTWHFTKYAISEKELPGPVITDFKANYKGYFIKIVDMVTEPTSKSDYYYIYAKMEGIGVPSVELYYTMAGKFIKKVTSLEKTITQETDDAIKEGKKNKEEGNDAITNSEEVISKKELPTLAINYVKQVYKEYQIKSVILSTSEAGTFYFVKIKKEGVPDIIELQFDIKGKYVEPKE